MFFQNSEIPFLPEDEFSYEVEFFLKKKAIVNTEIYTASEKNSSADVLPYIKLNFSLNKFQPTDRRIKVFRNDLVLNSKKIKGPMLLSLDMGYSVDMKEGVTPSKYTIIIYTSENIPRAQILVRVEPSGELLINEVSSGMI